MSNSLALPFGTGQVMDAAMARITAERLIRHLARAGFVLMRQEPAAAPTTATMPSSTG
jgi:hypothetical protein